MRRILFSWHGWHIYSYPAMLYAGLLAGVFVGNGVHGHMKLEVGSHRRQLRLKVGDRVASRQDRGHHGRKSAPQPGHGRIVEIATRLKHGFR